MRPWQRPVSEAQREGYVAKGYHGPGSRHMRAARQPGRALVGQSSSRQAHAAQGDEAAVPSPPKDLVGAPNTHCSTDPGCRVATA